MATYEVKIKCSSCDWKDTVTIQLGEKFSSLPCPKCGNKHLVEQ